MTVDKRALFARLDYQPHESQLEVHTSEARFRVLACGVRWGKSLCAAMEAIAAALEPRARTFGWVVAPTYDLAEKVFREIRHVVMNHLQHRVIAMKESERRLEIRNLGGGVSEVRAKSADNPQSLLGEGLDFVIVDEAARLKPDIWQGHLSQRLLDKQGWALLISTPRGKGWFYDLWRRGQSEEFADTESWNLPSWTNPHLIRDEIEAERKRLPERSFKQEYGAEFIEGAGAVFRHVRDRATAEWQEPVPNAVYYAGLDLAKIEDYTVLVMVNDQREVVHVDRFHRLDWQFQIQRIKAAADRYNQARILCDTTGVGEPIYEYMVEAGCYVDAYPFTARSKDALVKNLAMMLEQDLLVLPRVELWQEGILELEAFEYSVTDSGNVRTSAPPGMHDDCVVALALAAWQVQPTMGIAVY